MVHFALKEKCCHQLLLAYLDLTKQEILCKRTIKSYSRMYSNSLLNGILLVAISRHHNLLNILYQ